MAQTSAWARYNSKGQAIRIANTTSRGRSRCDYNRRPARSELFRLWPVRRRARVSQYPSCAAAQPAQTIHLSMPSATSDAVRRKREASHDHCHLEKLTRRGDCRATERLQRRAARHRALGRRPYPAASSTLDARETTGQEVCAFDPTSHGGSAHDETRAERCRGVDPDADFGSPR